MGTVAHYPMTILARITEFGLACLLGCAVNVDPGAFVFDAHAVVDSLSFDTWLPNEEATSLMFLPGWASVPLYTNFDVTLGVLCNGSLVDVEVGFALLVDDVVGHPPQVTIGVPSTLTCPSTVTLTGSASDADNDLESVRWMVDGVLLDDSVTAIPFTQGHTLNLVGRDARGATKTAKKVVGCG